MANTSRSFWWRRVLPDHLVKIASDCKDITKTNILYSELSDFVRWMKSELTTEQRAEYGLNMDKHVNVFAPRFVVGQYMAARFNAFVAEARKNGIQVTAQKRNDLSPKLTVRL